MKKVIIDFVRGNEGYSLQVVDKNGGGFRFAGPKAWGNPYNKPTASFEIDVNEFIECLKRIAYEVGDE